MECDAGLKGDISFKSSGRSISVNKFRDAVSFARKIRVGSIYRMKMIIVVNFLQPVPTINLGRFQGFFYSRHILLLL